MVLVQGRSCVQPKHVCLSWLDDETLPFARCATYARSVECARERVAMRFCIDRTEVTQPGNDLPTSDLSYVRAVALCRERGRRLCLESEWTFACEGEEMQPYPYGYERRPVCNQDRTDLSDKDGLRDYRAPASSFPECISPFGVQNMVGNVDELVQRDRPYDPRFRNALKGGWWMAGRNRCRPATTAHDDYFHQLQIGTRCCADAAGTPQSKAR
jgi:formylglycine-generating enzyme required for sulfatase activity